MKAQAYGRLIAWLRWWFGYPADPTVWHKWDGFWRGKSWRRQRSDGTWECLPRGETREDWEARQW